MEIEHRKENQFYKILNVLFIYNFTVEFIYEYARLFLKLQDLYGVLRHQCHMFEET